MVRVRSPGYPNASLEEAIEYARKIHERDRQNPVSREAAVQHMGFTGVTGTSDRAVSALMHYGLAEKAAKGEIRVTNLAVTIMHWDSPEEKRAALREAAFNPELFKDLKERYPVEPPSAPSLASYLSRQGFAATAIGPASKAFLETCYLLQRERAYESDGVGASEASDSTPEPLQERAKMDTPAQQSGPSPSRPPVSLPIAALILNDPNLSIRSGTVHIEALLDFDGLAELENQIKALKLIMKPKAGAVPSAARPDMVEKPGEE